MNDIKLELSEHFSDTIKVEHASDDDWFALAYALWECKEFEKGFSKPLFHYDQWTSVIKFIEESIQKIVGGEKESIEGKVVDWII